MSSILITTCKLLIKDRVLKDYHTQFDSIDYLKYYTEVMIVFGEYTERNREVLQMWLDKEPDAFDFTPFFKYVVQDLRSYQECVKQKCSIFIVY